MIAPARTAAFHALLAVHTGQADLPAALARSREPLADDRDRALALEIATGASRWQRALDHLIGYYAKRPLNQLDAAVLVILRLSLYQILHLDRVPAAAVVDDAVDLCRAARKGHAGGFVNAVLRSTLRGRSRLPLPPRPDAGGDRAAELAYLGITHSHPDWLVRRWLDRYGFARTEEWVRFNNRAPRLMLRANRLQGSPEALRALLSSCGVETAAARFAPHGVEVLSGNPLRAGLDAGAFLVQDEASQLVSRVVGARPGDLVLDLCASPGGKTTDLAADVGHDGLIVASDVRDRRMRLLSDTVRAAGARRVRLVRVAGAGPLPFGDAFDRVLVDAPCSGLGTLRRDPDIRWKRREQDLAGLADRQRDLLARAAAVVRPGGRLIYATCSSEPEENERVVDAFLVEHPDFEPIDLRPGGSAIARDLFDDRGHLRTVPFAHGLEAFFAAALRRGRHA
jgi:16S rRNA (cytosine967-C5)-methyltransferase